MTNPTHQEIIEAHKALGNLARLSKKSAPFILDSSRKIDVLHRAVLKVLPPNPKPTMDNGEWNDDCLLYTSPSPRDLSTSRMPSSA